MLKSPQSIIKKKTKSKITQKTTQKILPYQTNEFFIEGLDNPSDKSVYSKERGYIYINIAINELPVFQNLYNKFNSKIEVNYDKLSKYGIIKNDKTICEYVFMRLFRFLFYLDFLHDFGDKNRNNYIFKKIEQTTTKKRDLKKDNKDKIKQDKNNKKNDIINTYNNVYVEDIKDIANQVVNWNFQYNISNLDNNIEIDIPNFNFNNFDNVTILKKLSEEQIKDLSLKIINFFDISENITSDANKNCGETFDDMLKNMNSEIKDSKKKVELFVDADKYKLSYYPIIVKFCSILLNDDISNIFSINLNTSLINNYDSASGNKLQSIIEQLKRIYRGSKNVNNLNVVQLPFNTVKMVFKLDREDDYDERFIELHFERDTKDDKTMLIINRFFTSESPENIKTSFIDSSVANVSIKMNDSLNKKKNIDKFVDEYFTQKDPINNKKLFELFKKIYGDYYDDNGKSMEENFVEYVTVEFRQQLYNDEGSKRTKEQVKLVMSDYGFVLDSYAKTLGDFTQMILVYQLSKINKNDIYLFITLDKIASYISSIFNSGTISENQNNPLEPLKYFDINFDLSCGSSSNCNNSITETKTYTLFQRLKKKIFGMDTSKFGKYNKSVKVSKLSKMERIHNLAKKYNVSYKNLTYKQLYDKLHKLYKLQLLAKKMKIPITYTKKQSTIQGTKQSSQNKRIYKSISMLEKETKKLNKK